MVRKLLVLISSNLLQRWGKFNAIGVLGAGLQLLLVKLLHTSAALPVGLATIIAVELTLLHNFYWHLHWTWADTTLATAFNQRCRQFFRFQLSNGLVSLVGNLLLTTWLVNELRCSLVMANALAIAICAGGNFLLAQCWVFSSSVK
jgi:putative flippase GtrA